MNNTNNFLNQFSLKYNKEYLQNLRVSLKKNNK